MFNDVAMLWVTVTSYEGVSAARLKQSGTLDQAALDEIRISARQALQRIHEQGVLHGDVAPRNALFRERDGKVLWIDFQSAKVFNDSLEEEKEPEVDVSEEEDGDDESGSPVSFDRKRRHELQDFDDLWEDF